MDDDRQRQTSRIYHAALLKPVPDRAAFVREACGGDDVVQREVESLLALDSSAQNFLNAPAAAAAARLMADLHHESLIGRQLGVYHVESLVGSGGMGAVYRARDTKLGRDVAIKILPRVFTSDPERLARFEREARVLAALNHPHIGAIYGVGDADGIPALILEMIEGQTLADRLAKAPLPLSESLTIARQIADALGAAHEKGIIHRDLKPGNIKISPNGVVKVLDFGLAKAAIGDGPTTGLPQSPTVTVGTTREGVILGTAAYMSPEQARGNPVDKRTDIWAFGCVLFEMLTGHVAFAGDTVADTIAKILERDPNWEALPAETPAKLRDLLRRCLQKDLHRRFRDAADIGIELEEVLTASALERQSTLKSSVPRGRWRVPILSLGALLLGAAVASLVVWNLRPTLPMPVNRSVITLPPGQQLAGLDDGPAVAISPDGGQLVYVARQGGLQQLYLRSLDSLEARPISGTEGAANPFFSPDGKWVGFFSGDTLKKISTNGGAPLTLQHASVASGASWSSRGLIAFAPRTSVLQQVSDAGGIPQPVTRFEKGELAHRWPEFLPGGRAVLFAAGTSIPNWTDAQIAVLSVGTGERRNLIQGGMQPRYAPSGYLAYAQGGRLMAVRFDAERLELTGTPVPVVEGVLQSPATGFAQYSVSATGSLAYLPAGPQATPRRLVWVSRSGVEQSIAAPEHVYWNPRVSPDGQRLAVQIMEPEAQIWLYDLSRETLTPVTSGGNGNGSPVWTPDGKRITFSSNREGKGQQNLFWQPADGGGGFERLASAEYSHIPSSWSPDGQLLAFTESNPNTGGDVGVLRLGDRVAQPFIRTPAREYAPQFSPDGRWLAYVSNESGRPEICVQPYPGPGKKWQLSTTGGAEPVWNPNGRELFYRSGNKMMAVEIVTRPSFVAGKARMLFEGPYVTTSPVFTSPLYDVAPDGQRFLMLKATEQAQAAPTQINVVLNWTEELKRLVPKK